MPVGGRDSMQLQDYRQRFVAQADPGGIHASTRPLRTHRVKGPDAGNTIRQDFERFFFCRFNCCCRDAERLQRIRVRCRRAARSGHQAAGGGYEFFSRTPNSSLV